MAHQPRDRDGKIETQDGWRPSARYRRRSKHSGVVGSVFVKAKMLRLQVHVIGAYMA